jgi:hypothetical protein
VDNQPENTINRSQKKVRVNKYPSQYRVSPKAVGSGEQERKREQERRFSKISGSRSVSATFFIQYIKYIYIKHAECRINCKKHENIDIRSFN